MSKNKALDARCAFALFKISNYTRNDEGAKAERLAIECGRESHPNKTPSPLLAYEPELLAAFNVGYDERAEELRPRTAEELSGKINLLLKEANAGCGLFYELFEQNFNSSGRAWLRKLPDQDKKLGLELLKKAGYVENPKGYWRYDPEENDVVYHEH